MCVTITWVLFTSQMLDGKYLQSLIIYLTFFFFFFVFIRECLLCWSEVRDSKLAITRSVFVMSWHKDPLVFQNEWLD